MNYVILKYLSQNNLPFYNIMVMESNDLLKKIKKINFINNQEYQINLR